MSGHAPCPGYTTCLGWLRMQGIVGSTPWNALVFNTLYLQLLGMSDFQASLISALFLAGTAVGALVRFRGPLGTPPAALPGPAC